MKPDEPEQNRPVADNGSAAENPGAAEVAAGAEGVGSPDPALPGAAAAGTEAPPPVAEAVAKPKPGKSVMREWLETVVIALVVALLIRAFVVQVYLVEGESMEPTLHTSERLLVNKFVYRLRPPQPGEIVVLQDPGQPRRELIKRIVAVAGETVEVRRSVVYVNQKPLREPYKNTMFIQYADMGPLTVPSGYIFVMGDNRGRSLDSRMIGPIPLAKVEGKAFFLFWPPGRFMAPELEHPREFE